MENNGKKNGHSKVVFFINKEKFEAEQTQFSVRELLTNFARVDPQHKTLALKDGNNFKELTNVDQILELKDGTHFVLFDNSPTPVS